THGGRRGAGLDAVEWAAHGAELGAGEILLNSMDADGTRDGFDVELIRAVRAVVEVPVIASGGAGAVADFPLAVAAGADAVLAAWTLAVVVVGSLALRRLRPAPPARLGWPAWLLVGGLAALVLAELVVALVAAPNNADSLSYHLPRIENWAQNRSVELYPT